MKNLILIPVKLTSKRLPQKNINDLCGKPMFEWVVDEALKTELGEVWVNSEDQEFIIEIYGMYQKNLHGFVRTKEMAEDPNGIDEVATEMLVYWDGLHEFETLIILQADCPLTAKEDIKGAYNLHKKSGQSACSISIVGNKDEGYYGQDVGGLFGLYEQPYQKTGAITIISVEEFMKGKTRHVRNQVGYEIPQERSIDVNNSHDFQIAELLMKGRLENEKRNKGS